MRLQTKGLHCKMNTFVCKLAPKLYHTILARVKPKLQIICGLLQFNFAFIFSKLRFRAKTRYNRHMDKNTQTPKLVQDRKTGEWYNPQEKFDQLLKSEFFQKIMLRLKNL